MPIINSVFYPSAIRSEEVQFDLALRTRTPLYPDRRLIVARGPAVYRFARKGPEKGRKIRDYNTPDARRMLIDRRDAVRRVEYNHTTIHRHVSMTKIRCYVSTNAFHTFYLRRKRVTGREVGGKN